MPILQKKLRLGEELRGELDLCPIPPYTCTLLLTSSPNPTFPYLKLCDYALCTVRHQENALENNNWNGPEAVILFCSPILQSRKLRS